MMNLCEKSGALERGKRWKIPVLFAVILSEKVVKIDKCV
jgi:hypothetical protein